MILPRGTCMRFHPVRLAGVVLVAAVVLAPLGLIFYQSLLSAPFFSPAAVAGSNDSSLIMMRATSSVA